MLNNRLIIIIVSIVLVLSMVIGLVVFFVNNKNDEPNETDTPTDTGNADTDQGIVLEPDWNVEHETNGSVVEFEDGAEVYLDTSLVAYLNRMEFGVPAVNDNGNYYFDKDGDIVYDMSEEVHLEGVLDTLISLINHYAKLNYPMEASHQLQRFYVIYYDRLDSLSFEELTSKLSTCFPSTGANAETLGKQVLNTFGIGSSDDCAFVFSPIAVSDIKVEFYNVEPADVTLSDEEKALCIYEDVKLEGGEDYQRNLEEWLHNVISVSKENGIDDERAIVAQILFNGTLADIEYRSHWKDALVRCLTIEEWNYEAFKAVVESEFAVSIDHNVPLQDYFENLNNEVSA